jgi:hypothetical protein
VWWMYRDGWVYVCVSEYKDYGVCVVDVQGWWGVCVFVRVQGLWGLCGGCTMVVVGVSNENKNRVFVNWHFILTFSIYNKRLLRS